MSIDTIGNRADESTEEPLRFSTTTVEKDTHWLEFSLRRGAEFADDRLGCEETAARRHSLYRLIVRGLLIVVLEARCLGMSCESSNRKPRAVSNGLPTSVMPR